MRLFEEDVQHLVLGGSPFEFEATSSLGQEIILISKPLDLARAPSAPASTEGSGDSDVVRPTGPSRAVTLE